MSAFCYTQEPNWHTPSAMKLKHDIAHIDWLLDKSSLTQKLIEKSQGHFRVELLQQSIHAISFAEKRALGLSPRQWAVSREVILYGNQTPWVYARTVIPISTLKGALRRLYYLGNKPLGEALFADPSMKRESVEIAQFHCQHLPIAPAINAATWGRRSVFRLSNKPLLVSEIFLPDLFIDAS